MSCNYTLKNTGVNGCIPIMDVARKVYIVPLYANDGTKNKIAKADTVNDAYIVAKINHVDKSKRWYPLPNLKNVESTKEDNVLETFSDGTTEFIHEGVRNFKAWIVSTDPALKEAIESHRVNQFGIYIVDEMLSLAGEISTDGLSLYPITVENKTLSVKRVDATDSTVIKLEVMFQFSRLVKDENLSVLTVDEMDNINLLTYDGLLDATATVSDITNTSFIVDVKLVSKSLKKTYPVIGLLLANSTLSGVTITSVTETSEGIYAYVVPSTTGVKTLTIQKNGYEIPSISVDFGV